MNAHEPLVYRPIFLERVLWLLSSIRIGTKSIRALQLEDIGYHLLVKAMTLPLNATAHEFHPILERAATLSPSAWAFLASAPGGRKVLVDNEFLKVVLIRWEPGAECARHYHPLGGGMIMVLEGSIQESRFLNDTIATPYEVRSLQQHGMSYIDDQLGAHVVANPNEKAAITLHAYLKYRPAGGA